MMCLQPSLKMMILVHGIGDMLARFDRDQILGMDIKLETLVPVGSTRFNQVEETAGVGGPDRAVVGRVPTAVRERRPQGSMYSVALFGMRRLRRICPTQTIDMCFESVVQRKMNLCNRSFGTSANG